MRIKTLLLLVLITSLVAFGCAGGGGGGAASTTADDTTTAPTTTSVSVRVTMQTVSGSISMNALGTADDITSISIEAIKVAGGASLGTSILEFDGSAWTGVLTEVPYDTSINFVAKAYDSNSVEIFNGTQTQTLVSGGSTEITISLSSVDDGVQPNNPAIVSASLPNLTLAGASPYAISFAITHTSTISYTLATTLGGLGLLATDTPATTISGTHDPATALSMYYFPPTTAGTTSLTLTVSDATGSDEVGSGYSITTIEEDPDTWTDPDVVIVVGPTISGMEFFRSATALKVTAVTDPTSDLTYSWSGTGSFSSITFSGTPLFITDFTDDMAGDLSVTVSDANGNQAFLSRTIEAGDFPYDVTGYIADLPGMYIYDETTNLLWQDNTNRVSRTWDDAQTTCADLNIAGYTVWRLPTVSELITMYSRAADFSNTYADEYWSGEAVDASNSYTVDYSDGLEYSDANSKKHFVRCVKAPE